MDNRLDCSANQGDSVSDSRTNQDSGQPALRTRRFKRACLAQLLSATACLGMTLSGTASADEAATTLLELPPIQLVGGTMQANPFVGPLQIPSTQEITATQAAGKVRLASDHQLSEIRLKSIGSAVGLLPMGSPPQTSPALIVEPAKPSQVRINPMARTSTQPTSTDAQSATPQETLTRPDQVAPSHPAITVEPTMMIPIENLEDIQETTHANSNELVELAASPTDSATAAPSCETAESCSAEASVKQEAIESDPICFSISDDECSLDAPLNNPSTRESAEWVEPENEEKLNQRSIAEFIVDPPKDNMGNTDNGSLTSKDLPLLPVPEAPHLDRSEKPSEDSTERYPGRRLPSVAVSSPPMAAIAQQANDARVTPAPIRAVVASHRLDSHSTKSTRQQHRCEVTDVVSLSVPGLIRDIQVKDRSVCRVVGSVSRHLRLIGQRDGKTDVIVKFVDDESGEHRKATYEILVATPKPKQLLSKDEHHDLMRLIEKAHPSAQVSLSRAENRIIVRGVCDDSDQATQIVRMIRKAYLVPVSDQLVIR